MKKVFTVSRILIGTIAFTISLPGVQSSAGQPPPFATWSGKGYKPVSQVNKSLEVNPEGDWEGTLDAGAAKLRLVIHVTKKDGRLSATLDSPIRGRPAWQSTLSMSLRTRSGSR